jgi:hypothetical protein
MAIEIWPPFQLFDLFYTAGRLLGRGISPPQGRYLHTGKHNTENKLTQMAFVSASHGCHVVINDYDRLKM